VLVLSNYQTYAQDPLPWRWMALECLTTYSFSSASDVWSFGVTAWEIFQFGDTPYPSRTWDLSFIDDLESGLRLPEPKLCSPEM